MRTWLLATLMVAFVPVAASAADVEAGKATFTKCKACHQVGDGAKNSAGPVLNGVVGRKAGIFEGYAYSAKLKDSGVTWDEANLKEWLANPRKKVPGTKMIFPGLKDPADIDNVIAYLTTLK